MTPGDSKDETLDHDLASLSSEVRRRLDNAGFDSARLKKLAATLVGGASGDARRDGRNRVREVKAPSSDEILVAPTRGTPEAKHLLALGEAAIARGEVAFCVMAGGMATRMGGVVKALVEAVPGKTFLDLRLAENKTISDRVGRPVPLWLMTSEATQEGIASALANSQAPAHVKTFTQDLGLRLTAEGRLFVDGEGEPSVYATGHGDLVDALRRSGLLRAFRQAGGRYVWIANLDNLGASLDPTILGAFISSSSEVMVEVCEKASGDKGGIPVHAEGRLQVLEEFRLPKDFDASLVRVFNTNTFLVRADALETVDIPWSWFEVEKKVDGKVAIQFERLLQELTGALSATYIRVPREGTASRFLPVKDHDELARRQTEIASVARARGMLEK
ncbi:MAG: UTP--glucose-phosphate uridylyltransferase [Myxococcaceae bacterium]|nr:UTP--glucose-phosphate uridylyltransferase [Myxococcaceae bacterium]